MVDFGGADITLCTSRSVARWLMMADGVLQKPKDSIRLDASVLGDAIPVSRVSHLFPR